MSEPKPRANSRCRVCGKPRPALAVEHKDGFCRSECAREFYNEQLPCSGCNCRYDTVTEGCVTCAVRTRRKKRRVRYERVPKQKAPA